MGKPRLTFFCEMAAAELRAVFSSPSLYEDLRALDASISLGILDLGAERVEVVKRLNSAGIPVIAWLLLPEEQGYWFNLDNAPQAQAYYQEFINWTESNELHWSGIGFDIEPDIHDLQQVAGNGWRLLPKVFQRIFDGGRLRRAQQDYADLVKQAQQDGYLVESYQFPVIVDERIAGSNLLRKVTGLVDLRVDREVLMIYTSALRPYGAGVLWDYGRECTPLEPAYLKPRPVRRSCRARMFAIGLGSTGGGIELEFMDQHPLQWAELARDLRYAWYWCNEVYIFSLEGCLQQGFLTDLRSFDWEGPMLLPIHQSRLVRRWRRILQGILWVSAHPLVVLLSLAGAAWLATRLRRLASARE